MRHGEVNEAQFWVSDPEGETKTSEAKSNRSMTEVCPESFVPEDCMSISSVKVMKGRNHSSLRYERDDVFTYRVEPHSVPVQRDEVRVESEGENEGEVKVYEVGAWLKRR